MKLKKIRKKKNERKETNGTKKYIHIYISTRRWKNILKELVDFFFSLTTRTDEYKGEITTEQNIKRIMKILITTKDE